MTTLEELKQEEERSRTMLERQVSKVVNRLRSMADQIESEARHGIRDAAEGARDYHTYNRVAQQIVHEITWGVANTNLGSVLLAADDAQQARAAYLRADEMAKTGTTDLEVLVSSVLYALLVNLDGWIEGARSNHDVLDHQGEAMQDECTRWHPADFRSMVNHVAREFGVSEFPKPEVPKEDAVR
jgi:hypothetical protein